MESTEKLELADWRRRIFDLYRNVRRSDEPSKAWDLWVQTRDRLFATHPQSPLPRSARDAFTGLELFDYDPAYRVIGEVRALPDERYDIATSGDAAFGFTRFAAVDFRLRDENLSLELYWLDGYGGGIFLPFKDATSGKTTYGGGRYLLDTVKGADLGEQDGRLLLDFNFAYNPSCSYDPAWVCPLSPPENRLQIPVEAGEKHP